MIEVQKTSDSYRIKLQNDSRALADRIENEYIAFSHAGLVEMSIGKLLENKEEKGWGGAWMGYGGIESCDAEVQGTCPDFICCVRFFELCIYFTRVHRS